MITGNIFVFQNEGLLAKVLCIVRILFGGMGLMQMG